MTKKRQPRIAPFVLSAMLMVTIASSVIDPATLILPLFFVALVPAVSFPLLYFFRSPWRTTLVGRMMMTKSSAVATILLVSLIRFLVPDAPGRDLFIALAYAFLDTALFVQCFVLLREQHHDDEDGHTGAEVGQASR